MWIFCGGMYRAASTLQYQLTSHLLEQSGRAHRIGWVASELFPRLSREIDSKKWHILKTHYCSDVMAEEFHRGNAIGVYIYRDIRDVFVSAMVKDQQTFKQVWARNLIDSCLNNYESWTRLPNVLVSRYESVIVDLPGEVSAIARHFHIDLTEVEAREIAAEYTLDKQRKRIANASNFERVGPYAIEPKSLLHFDHINSGSVDQWKDVLSVNQICLIENRAREWLLARNYELS